MHRPARRLHLEALEAREQPAYFVLTQSAVSGQLMSAATHTVDGTVYDSGTDTHSITAGDQSFITDFHFWRSARHITNYESNESRISLAADTSVSLSNDPIFEDGRFQGVSEATAKTELTMKLEPDYLDAVGDWYQLLKDSDFGFADGLGASGRLVTPNGTVEWSEQTPFPPAGVRIRVGETFTVSVSAAAAVTLDYTQQDPLEDGVTVGENSSIAAAFTFEPARSNLHADALTYDPSSRQYTAAYQVQHHPLSRQSNVYLVWMDKPPIPLGSDHLQDVGPAAVYLEAAKYTIPDDTAPGSFQEVVSADTLVPAPAGAKYLVMYLGSDDQTAQETDYNDNEKFVAIPVAPIEVTATAGRDEIGTATDKEFGTYLAGVHMPDLKFTAKTAADGVKKFDFTIAGQYRGTVNNTSNGGVFPFDPFSLKAGTHALKVVARGANGQAIGEPYNGTIKVIDRVAATVTANPGGGTTAVGVADLRLIDGVSAPVSYTVTVADLPLPGFYKDKLGVTFQNKRTKAHTIAPVTLEGGTATFTQNALKTADVHADPATDDYDVFLLPSGPKSGALSQRLSDPAGLFVTKLPKWMKTPKAKSFGSLPADIFPGGTQGYTFDVTVADGASLALGKTSDTPFDLLNGLDNSFNMGFGLRVYAKLTEAGDAEVRVADGAYVKATLLGRSLLDTSSKLASTDFTVTGQLSGKTLDGAGLTVKSNGLVNLLGKAKELVDETYTMPSLTLPVFHGVGVSARLSASFKASLRQLAADAQVKLIFPEAGGLKIDKANTHLGLFALLRADATLQGSAGLSVGVGDKGSFDLISVRGEGKAQFDLSGYLKANFDDKSATLNMAESRAQLDVQYSLKYNLNILGLFDTSDPSDPPQVTGKLKTIPLFGLPGPTTTTDLTNPSNVKTTGTGISTGGAGSVPAAPDLAPDGLPAVSKLQLRRPFYDDLERVRVTVTPQANVETPTAGAHVLDIVLASSEGDVVLASRDLAAETYTADANPLGFEAAPIALDLEVPPDALAPFTQYHLEFRLRSDPGATGEEARVVLDGFSVVEGRPDLAVSAAGADLADGGLDFGPDTAGLGQAVIDIRNDGTSLLAVGQMKLVGRGYELIDVPAKSFALAPGESHGVRVRLLSSAAAATAKLQIPSDDPDTPMREVALRYAPSAVAQQVSFVSPVAGGSEKAAGRLTVVLARPAQGKVTVDYAVTGGTAVSGTDFKPFNGTLTFMPGQTMKHITVPALDNKTNQALRTIMVGLSNPTGGAILGAVPSATYTIRDDDPLVAFRDSTVTVTEGPVRKTILLPVELSSPSSGVVSVGYKVTGGDATNGRDHTGAAGRLTFAAGQTRKDISLAILADRLVETNETLTITLFSPVGGLLGGQTSLTVTIGDLA